MIDASDSPSAWPGSYKDDKKQKRPDRVLYTPKRKEQSSHAERKSNHGKHIQKSARSKKKTRDTKKTSSRKDNLTDNVIDLSLKDNRVSKDIEEECHNVLGTVLDLVCNGMSTLATNGIEKSICCESSGSDTDTINPTNNGNIINKLMDNTSKLNDTQEQDKDIATTNNLHDNEKIEAQDEMIVKNEQDYQSEITAKFVSKLRSDLNETYELNKIYQPKEQYRKPISWRQPEEYDSEEETGFDDWDHNWNEDGDCLDKSLRKELKKLTGIKHPVVHKTDLSYIGKESDDLNDIDSDVLGCGNILEIYGFSPNYKTSHLALALTTMGLKDYEIQWVDDTSALVIFESMMAAASAMSTKCAYARLRYAADASPAAKAKAKLFRGSRRSYKPRPETTAHVARNLVANALGLGASVSKERRAADREKIRKAKADKIAREKHRRDIWES